MGDQRVYREHKYEFGKQVLALRTRAALTQSGLAAAVGVHRRSVQNWETGISYPKAEILQRLIVIYLRHRAFTPGREREEAWALWNLSAQDGRQTFAAFDETWFAHAWSVYGEALADDHGGEAQPVDAAVSLAGRPDTARAFVDENEAIAVSTLYGRETDLDTMQRWIIDHRCRVVTIVGLGGIGKSSLAIATARRLLPQFERVLFRSLQNGPSPTELLDQTIRAFSDQRVMPPATVADKIARLVQLMQEQRCLLVLDNYETILQPGALTGTYRAGYGDYGELLRQLSQRSHASCLVLTSREKPTELGPFEGHAMPVRTLQLSSLSYGACESLLAAKEIVGTPGDVQALVHLYGGNPLALQLVAEPIRELFAGDIASFLALGDAFFSGVGQLLEQHLARSTPLEQAVLYWLAIERELVPFSALLTLVGAAVSRREVLAALESLRRRVLIERGSDRLAFSLQPVILEFVTDRLGHSVAQEIVDGRPQLLLSHPLVQASAKEYVRLSQERLIAAPLLERLVALAGGAVMAERRLLALLASWRRRPVAEQGYGPGAVVNLLRLLRGHLGGLELSQLALRQAYLQGVEMRDTSLADAAIQECVFTETFDAIRSVGFSPTGEYCAAGSRRGEVRVWLGGSLTLHRMWRAHDDMVSALAFSPDGRTVATAGAWDGAVKVWDPSSGALLWSGSHTSRINSVAFAPGGGRLASSGDDGVVRIWDVTTGAELQVLPHPGHVAVVAWSLDGQRLASGDMAGDIWLWELSQAEPTTTSWMLEGHTNAVAGLAFAPDGTLASASWDHTVRLWNCQERRVQRTLRGHIDRVSRVAWSPDGLTLASTGRDRTIWLWDVGRSSYRVVLQGHGAEIDGLAFTPDGARLLSGSEDGTLRLWDAARGVCTRVIQGYAASLYDVDWSPDGAQVVSGGSDRVVAIHSVADGVTERVLHGHGGGVIGVSWRPDGRVIASSEWHNAIRLWDPAGTCLHVLAYPDDTGNFFDQLAWSRDGERLAAGTYTHGAAIFEIAAKGLAHANRAFPTWIRHVAWSPDGTRLAGGGADGTLYLWEAAEATPPHRLGGHRSSVTCVAWSPDGTQLVSGSGDRASGELFVWDARRGSRSQMLGAHPSMVTAVAWGAGEDTVVSGGADGALRWWDLQRSLCLEVRHGHRGVVQALRRSPDGTRLASCGDDGAVRIWDLRSGAHLTTLRRDRPYERLDITGIRGVTEAQLAMLRMLGAIERRNDCST
jgi:WD40 repeat protein/transcriptional regulator with XRE-family HTH domain